MTDQQSAHSPQISIEFFPPKSEAGFESLERVVGRLNELHPDFYSCTYGAGGSTRTGTRETIERIMALGAEAAPHLSIGGDDRSAIFELLDQYKALGVKRIVALRGDLPSGMGAARIPHNAEALVRWIREHSADHFHIEVAAYPEIHPDATSPESDLEFFKAKVAAGANSAITQFFFTPYGYYDFVDRASRAGVTLPIYPGILPITNVEGVLRIASKSGADVPRWLQRRMESLADDSSGLMQFGVEVLSRMCEELLDNGAPGLHFYSLNRWGATRSICQNLGLADLR